MFQELRPVGNRVKLCPSKMDQELFRPFSFVGFQSGTAALAAALVAVRQSHPSIKSPEALLPAYTCPDVISACLFAKVKPVLVDFEADTSWLDLDAMSARISPSCIAIIAINFLGIPERIDSIRSVIDNTKFDSQKITIIEDSAQGFPQMNADIYWQGDIIICSFGRGKPLNLMGGGGIFFNPDKLDKKTHKALSKFSGQIDTEGSKLYSVLKYHLKVRLFNLLSFSFFYFMLSRIPFTNLGTTVFHPLASMKKLPEFIEKQFNINYKNYSNKDTIRSKYDDILKKLNSSHYTSLPIQASLPIDFPLLRYPLLIKDKNIQQMLYAELSNSGLGVSKMYKQILPSVEGVEKSIFGKQVNYTNAEKFAASLITLPLHQDVNQGHIDRITNILSEYA